MSGRSVASWCRLQGAGATWQRHCHEPKCEANGLHAVKLVPLGVVQTDPILIQEYLTPIVTPRKTETLGEVGTETIACAIAGYYHAHPRGKTRRCQLRARHQSFRQLQCRTEAPHFGTELSPADKSALIEYLKAFEHDR
jgi:hypothetical protein